MAKATERLFLPFLRRLCPEIARHRHAPRGRLPQLRRRLDQEALPRPGAQGDELPLGHGPDDVHEAHHRGRRRRRPAGPIEVLGGSSTTSTPGRDLVLSEGPLDALDHSSPRPRFGTQARRRRHAKTPRGGSPPGLARRADDPGVTRHSRRPVEGLRHRSLEPQVNWPGWADAVIFRHTLFTLPLALTASSWTAPAAPGLEARLVVVAVVAGRTRGQRHQPGGRRGLSTPPTPARRHGTYPPEGDPSGDLLFFDRRDARPHGPGRRHARLAVHRPSPGCRDPGLRLLVYQALHLAVPLLAGRHLRDRDHGLLYRPLRPLSSSGTSSSPGRWPSWVAGFDIIYALQDIDSTARRDCSPSRPVRCPGRAWSSPARHVGTIVLLA